jgi:hypothetical protein
MFTSLSIMSYVRQFAQMSMARIIPAAESCRLHRIYKVSFETGEKYIGQTSRMPKLRLKEHARDSSNCKLLKECLKSGTPHTLDVLAVSGSHNIDVLERVAIALENTVTPNGLNITIGGPGVKKPNAAYERLSRDARLISEQLKKGSFVSYDILFMRGDISMTEEEFSAVKYFS